MTAVAALLFFIGALIAIPTLAFRAFARRDSGGAPASSAVVPVIAGIAGVAATLLFVVGCVMTIQFAGGDTAEAERGQQVILLVLPAFAASVVALTKARLSVWATAAAAALTAAAFGVALLN